MIKSIRNKVAAASAIVLVACSAIAGVGLWVTSTLTGALERSAASAEVLRNHMQADMMHDALRSDVLSAVLSTNPQSGIVLSDVSQELTEHSTTFKEALAANRTLARNPEVQTALADVQQPLEAYIAAAGRIVELAGRDAAAASAGMTDFKASFVDLEERMEATADVIGAAAAADKLRAEQQAALARTLMFVALATGLLIGAGLTVIGIRTIVRPIRALTDGMVALAGGRTDVVLSGLDRADEVGAIGRAVGALQTLIVTRMQEEAAAAEQQREAAEAERARNEAEKARAAEEDRVTVEALGRGLAAMAQGDLTHRFTAEVAPRAAELKTNFNAAIAQLQEAMAVVVTNVSAIRSGAGEISQAADDLSRRTEQQAASLEETAAALDEITATVNRTASGARQASETVQAAKGDAETSGVVVRDAVGAMGAIEKSAQEISQIIGVIDEIAFQTNLLALNAGVEAARAGDAGRGFAVVASEVRALAQRSAEAAKEIKVLISASTTQVNSGVSLVGQTGEALQRIVSRVAEIDGLVSEIAASAQEQATGLQQVNTAVNQMDQVTQQNAAMVEQSTAASHSLAQEAETLAGSVARFQIGAVAAAPARAAPRPAHRTVTAMKTVGHGGAVRKPEPVAAEDGWEEF